MNRKFILFTYANLLIGTIIFGNDNSQNSLQKNTRRPIEIIINRGYEKDFPEEKVQINNENAVPDSSEIIEHEYYMESTIKKTVYSELDNTNYEITVNTKQSRLPSYIPPSAPSTTHAEDETLVPIQKTYNKFLIYAGVLSGALSIAYILQNLWSSDEVLSLFWANWISENISNDDELLHEKLIEMINQKYADSINRSQLFSMEVDHEIAILEKYLKDNEPSYSRRFFSSVEKRLQKAQLTIQHLYYIKALIDN